MFTHSAGA